MARSPINKLPGLATLILVVFAVLLLLPIVAVVSISFSSENDIYSTGFSLIPAHVDLASYRFIFRSTSVISQAYALSFGLDVIGTLISVALTIMFAYPLTVRAFRLRKPLNKVLVVSLLFNGGMIPTYIVVTQFLHFENTIWGHIMPFAIFPFYVVLMRTFFKDIPGELRESAVVDGAGETTILARIVIPMSTPGIAAITLLTTLRIWNDTWYTGMLYMTGNALRTLPMYLQQMMDNIKVMALMASQMGVPLGDLPKETARMAMCVITIGPLLLMFPFFQRYFVKGMVLGAIKG
jgi:putative aldouronate transport system permease protein